MSADLRQSYDELRSGLKFDAGRDTLLRYPSNEERNKFMARMIVINTALRSISYTKHGSAMGLAGAAVAEMFQGFITWKPDPKVKEESIGWYVHELRDLPLVAIERACMDVRQGRVPDLKPDFPPSSSRVVQLARAHAEHVNSERLIIKRILTVGELRVDHTFDPVAAERVHHGLRQLADTLGANIRREEDARIKESTDKATARNNNEILREYQARGIPPVYGPNGKLVSISLLRNIEEAKERELKLPPRRDKD